MGGLKKLLTDLAESLFGKQVVEMVIDRIINEENADKVKDEWAELQVKAREAAMDWLTEYCAKSETKYDDSVPGKIREAFGWPKPEAPDSE